MSDRKKKRPWRSEDDVPQHDAFDAVAPWRVNNPHAVASGYLGLLALLSGPLLYVPSVIWHMEWLVFVAGPVFGLPAISLGIVVVRDQSGPALRWERLRAWFGIIAGAIATLVTVAFVLFAVLVVEFLHR